VKRSCLFVCGLKLAGVVALEGITDGVMPTENGRPTAAKGGGCEG